VLFAGADWLLATGDCVRSVNSACFPVPFSFDGIRAGALTISTTDISESDSEPESDPESESELDPELESDPELEEDEEL
jgi:hypothetical protein